VEQSQVLDLCLQILVVLVIPPHQEELWGYIQSPLFILLVVVEVEVGEQLQFQVGTVVMVILDVEVVEVVLALHLQVLEEQEDVVEMV
jgi:hypothetical protein